MGGTLYSDLCPWSKRKSKVKQEICSRSKDKFICKVHTTIDTLELEHNCILAKIYKKLRVKHGFYRKSRVKAYFRG